MLEKILFNKTLETVFIAISLYIVAFIFFCLANALAIMNGGDLFSFILTNTVFTLPCVALAIYGTYDHYKWSK